MDTLNETPYSNRKSSACIKTPLIKTNRQYQRLYNSEPHVFPYHYSPQFHMYIVMALYIFITMSQ